MPDLAAILCKARDIVKTGGNTGNTGNGFEFVCNVSSLDLASPVPSASLTLGTLGTSQPSVPSVPMAQFALGTEQIKKNSLSEQYVKGDVPSVPTVPTEKHDTCEKSVVDLTSNSAAQPSDWWGTPLMAEMDAVLAVTSACESALPISVDQVRASVEREMLTLAELGRVGPGASRDAITITRAKIRNSPVLIEPQTGSDHCLICDGAENAEQPFIALLSGRPRYYHWMHRDCHDEHSRRLSAKDEDIMAAAGYGEERKRGAA